MPARLPYWAGGGGAGGAGGVVVVGTTAVDVDAGTLVDGVFDGPTPTPVVPVSHPVSNVSDARTANGRRMAQTLARHRRAAITLAT